MGYDTRNRLRRRSYEFVENHAAGLVSVEKMPVLFWGAGESGVIKTEIK